MNALERAPENPRHLRPEEVMRTLSVGKERLALLIIQIPGLVSELREVDDEIPETVAKDQTQALPRQSKRFKKEGRVRIIDNPIGAIAALGWEPVVEYLQNNLFRMRFHSEAVNFCKGQRTNTQNKAEQRPETGGQLLYSEVTQILGMNKEELIKVLGKLSVSMPTHNINDMSESIIMHGFFDLEEEGKDMITNHEAFIIMRERTPGVQGFMALIRANIEAMYFDAEKVFKMKKEMIKKLEADTRPVPREEPQTTTRRPSPAPQAALDPKLTKPERPTVKTRRGGCRKLVFLSLLLAGSAAGAVYYHQKKVRAFLEEQGLYQLVEPYDPWAPKRTSTPPSSPAPVDSSDVPHRNRTDLDTSPTTTHHKTDEAPINSHTSSVSPRERFNRIQAMSATPTTKLMELYKLRDALGDSDSDVELKEEVLELIRNMESDSMREMGLEPGHKK